MRSVLNHVPTAVLALLVVGGTIVLAQVALHWVRKWGVASVDTDGAMDPLGLVGVAYGLILALVVFGLWSNFSAAHDTVTDEAAALAQVALDVRALPSADRARVENAISRYIRTVVNEEWRLMSVGRESARAHKALDEVAVELERTQPTTRAAESWYDEAVTKLNDAASARRHRIEAVEREMPAELRVLLFGGAIIPIGLVILISRRRMHVVLVGAIAALIAYILFLSIILDYPFSGSVRVSPAPFHHGVLAPLAR
jgi:hypothetical protein